MSYLQRLWELFFECSMSNVGRNLTDASVRWLHFEVFSAVQD